MSISAADFPDPPEGSPGGVRAAARSVGQAGDRLRALGRGLTAASGAIEADWQGWAAGTYLSCSRGLATAADNGAGIFDTCEQATSKYASILQAAQQEIKRLRGLWEQAKAREATASSQLDGLAGQLLGAKPSEVGGITDRMDAAAGAASDAGDEADRLRRQAYEVLDDFKRDAQGQADAISGKSPFSGPWSGTLGAPFGGLGLSGPGFGVPPGGLGSLNGVIAVDHPNQQVAKGMWEWVFDGFGAQEKTEENPYAATNIPGAYQRWGSIVTGVAYDSVQDSDDLLNLVMLGTGFAGKGVSALGAAARDIVAGGAERAGLTGGSRAIEEAGNLARLEADAVLAPGTRNRMAAIAAAGRNAEAAKQIEVEAAQGSMVEKIVDLAGKAGVELPPGASQISGHLISSRTAYRYWAAGQLLRIQMRLEQVGTSRAMRAADAIGRLFDRAAPPP